MNNSDKQTVGIARIWLPYKTTKPNKDRYVIVIKTNTNGYIYELKYCLYSEIEEDCPDIKWIDTPKTITETLEYNTNV